MSAGREQASQLRQQIKVHLDQVETLAEEVMGRGAMVKGTIYQRQRRCGRGGCRCQKGQLHTGEAFSYSDGGKTVHRRLAGKDVEQMRRCVGNYRRFRATRAELSKTCRGLLRLVDRMESARRIPCESFLGLENVEQTGERLG